MLELPGVGVLPGELDIAVRDVPSGLDGVSLIGYECIVDVESKSDNPAPQI